MRDLKSELQGYLCYKHLNDILSDFIIELDDILVFMEGKVKIPILYWMSFEILLCHVGLDN